MVAKRHKITNVPLFKKIWDIIFFFGTKNPHFLKQRDINSYYLEHVPSFFLSLSKCTTYVHVEII